MRRFLVTGGAGFIGSRFIATLLGQPEVQIVSLDLQPLHGIESQNCRHHQLNIGDPARLQPVLEAFRPDCVVHFAAATHVDESIEAPALYVENNIVAHHGLLQLIRDYWQQLDAPRQQAFRFIQVSTDEVYGQLDSTDAAFVETSPYQPNNPYSATKAAADHLVRAYHATWGLPVITTLSSNNYGPGQTVDKLIPKLISHALQNKLLPIYGDGSHVRDWLYVDDHCQAILEVIRHGETGQHYNICGECEQSNLAIAQRVCDLVDGMRPAATPRRELIRFVADRPGHDFRYAMNGTKLAGISQWRATTPLPQGLRQTVQWFLDQAGGITGS